MKKIARQLRSLIETVEAQLSEIKEKEAEIKPAPDEWSKKEILGHLIDSAANNHQRFVRAVYNAAADFPPYDQVQWVRIQQYNKSPWPMLISFWVNYNLHLSHLTESIPEEARSSPCNIGKEEPVSLDFVVKDYISHMQHHMKDLLD